MFRLKRQKKSEWVQILCIFGGQRFYSNGKPFFFTSMSCRVIQSTENLNMIFFLVNCENQGNMNQSLILSLIFD